MARAKESQAAVARAREVDLRLANPWHSTEIVLDSAHWQQLPSTPLRPQRHSAVRVKERKAVALTAFEFCDKLDVRVRAAAPAALDTGGEVFMLRGRGGGLLQLLPAACHTQYPLHVLLVFSLRINPGVTRRERRARVVIRGTNAGRHPIE